MARIVIFTQARLSSTRLPRKILADLCGAPLLSRHVERLKATAHPVVVLAPEGDRASAIPEVAKAAGAACAFGPEEDVLARFALGAAAFDAEVVVRATSDNPFVDPALIDLCLARFLAGEADYVTIRTDEPGGYPYGLNVEVFSRASLDLAASGARGADEREHVTPFFYNRPERFRVLRLGGGRGARFRLTVDRPEDLDLARRLWRELPKGFGWEDCVAALEAHPEWAAINAHLR